MKDESEISKGRAEGKSRNGAKISFRWRHLFESILLLLFFSFY